MTTCPACSTEIRETAKFCPECGAVLRPEILPTEAHDAARQPDEESATSESDSSQHGRFLPGTKLIGRYRIVSLLGKGGMGEVYRADDLKLGHTVALKFLPRDVADDPDRLQFFRNEVRLSRQVSHPNVCRVYDIGEVDGQHFLSMEYIDGEDLKSLLRRIGHLPKDKGIQTTRQLCAGLAAAHDKGVLHRDLKPANIMIDGRGQARITDFGLAQLASEQEREIAGTPAYMAPEQITRGETSIQSDLYSLGLIFFEMFTGERVQKSNTVAELRESHAVSSSAKPPSDLVADMDSATERVIMRCLEREPQDRPKSVAVAAASLPGGDPLAAAIAAGETPSPELVAASGEIGLLSPHIAGLCLVGVAAGLALVAISAERAYLVNRAPLDRAPAVLEDKANEMICHFGYVDTPVDSAIGFEMARHELDYIEKLDVLPSVSDRWDMLKEKHWPGVYFWYRQSPDWMCPFGFFAGFGKGFNRGRVRFRSPSWTQPGMVGVRLSPRGELRLFRAVPRVTTVRYNDEEIGRPQWSVWFPEKFIGFNLDDLSPAVWRRTPPDAFDSLQSWEGTWPDSNESLHVQAAAFRGQPVYFEVLHPSSVRPQVESATGGPEGGATGSVYHERGIRTAIWVLVAIELGAFALAWRNLRLRRGDRRGALRLALYVLSVSMVIWLLHASHTSLGDVEHGLFYIGLATATLSATLVWVYYMALEPFVRREWPTLLISWTRLLDGRMGDPRAGRDLLVGVLTGTLGFAFAMLPTWLGLLGRPTRFSAITLLGPDALIGSVLGAHLNSILLCLLVVVLLVLIRRLIRSGFLAASCIIVLLTMLFGLTEDLPPALWPFAAVFIGSGVWVLVRFGFVAYLAWTTAVSVLGLPITTNTSAFYFGNGLFAMAVVVVIALYGYYTSLGTKAASGEVALDRNR